VYRGILFDLNDSRGGGLPIGERGSKKQKSYGGYVVDLSLSYIY
jgi:hypothetical protein